MVERLRGGGVGIPETLILNLYCTANSATITWMSKGSFINGNGSVGTEDASFVALPDLVLMVSLSRNAGGGGGARSGKSLDP